MALVKLGCEIERLSQIDEVADLIEFHSSSAPPIHDVSSRKPTRARVPPPRLRQAVCVAHIVSREPHVYMLGAYKRARGRHRPAEALVVASPFYAAVAYRIALQNGAVVSQCDYSVAATGIQPGPGVDPVVGERLAAAAAGDDLH